MDPKYNKQEIADIEETAKQEARQQYAERQEKRFGRLADYSLDPENQKQYEIKKMSGRNRQKFYGMIQVFRKELHKEEKNGRSGMQYLIRKMLNLKSMILKLRSQISRSRLMTALKKKKNLRRKYTLILLDLLKIWRT